MSFDYTDCYSTDMDIEMDYVPQEAPMKRRQINFFRSKYHVNTVPVAEGRLKNDLIEFESKRLISKKFQILFSQYEILENGSIILFVTFINHFIIKFIFYIITYII